MSSSAGPSRSLLIVVSAPSGAGKTTICSLMLASREDITRSVSCTTRAPRGQEVDGRDYIFLTLDDFRRRLASGEFLEHAEVHGNYYGTLRSTVEGILKAGQSVLMVIDVQGAAQVRHYARMAPEGDLLKRGFVDIFVEPPSLAELRRRLEARGEDSIEVIERRLRNAEQEMKSAPEYRYRVVNDVLDKAARELNDIIRHETGS